MSALLEIWQDKERKVFSLLLLLFFVFLPFGSALFDVKIGPVTFYPSFVLLLVLFGRFIFEFAKWNKAFKLFVVFLFLWLVYAVSGRFWMSPIGLEEWKFDIRSLLFLWIFVSVLIGAFHFFGREKFKELFVYGLLTYTAVLVVSGVFEFYTGIHILGHFTDKMLLEPEVRPFFYSPVFRYDNPNDYLAYFNGILIMLGLYTLRNGKLNWLLFGLSFLSLFFAITGQSVFMSTVSTLLILWFGITCLYSYTGKWKLKKYWFIPLAICVGIYVFSQSNLFYGPKYSKGNHTVDKEYKSFPVSKSELGSVQIRRNLILNGFEYIKEAPITGIGAGQFRYRHHVGDKKHETGTVENPHNFLIEIVSQYGVFAWSFILFLLIGFIRTCRATIQDWRNNYALLIFFGLYPIFTLVPSAFLYQELNCLFIAILIIESYSIHRVGANEC